MLGDDAIEIRNASPIPNESSIQEIKELQRWYPKVRSKTDTDTFEIGLVLAGAVSAGSYTAGVMDFLFEALDEWYRRRLTDENLPNHNVVLRVITGASAGGINGAIAATASRYRFPPVTLDNVAKSGLQNPFFNTWVTGIDIRRLLDISDLQKMSPFRSVLNSQSLDELAVGIVNMKGDYNANKETRKWLEDPFKLLLTVTNLGGVPYEVRFTGGTHFGHEMIMHRDHMGFLVHVLANPDSSLPPPPDLVPLSPENCAKDPGWMSMAVAALASSAFPGALATRMVSRPGSDYDYRFVFPHANKHVVFSKPMICRSVDYRFSAVDGGMMNNEPFELARVELAGSKGRNPRGGQEAYRAVIMVDPFTDPRQDKPQPNESFLGTFKSMFMALKDQSRFNQIDLTLAKAGDVYSRFLIAPSRSTLKGSKVIASSGMGGFLGFFCEEYRLHDYMLGRANCQRFLRDWFVLPSDQTKTRECPETSNALFKKWPQPALDNNRYRSQSPLRKGHRQIIPLVGTADEEQKLADWPKGAFLGYESLMPQIEKRIDASYPIIKKEVVESIIQGQSVFSQAKRFAWHALVFLIWQCWLKKKVRQILKKLINNAVSKVDNADGKF